MSRDRVVIREATVEDAAQLARVLTEAFGPTSPSEIRRSMRRKVSRREWLVAVVNGVVVAHTSILYLDLVIRGVPLRTAGIGGVATRWDYRRRGLATKLLLEAIRRAKAKGVSNTTLFTGVNLTAKRIYERLGYAEARRWRRVQAVYSPVGALKSLFGWRSGWFKKTPFARSVLKEWRERVLFESSGWRATVTFDGKEFRVQAGKRGKPSVVVRGATRPLLEGFGNRLAYDSHVKRGDVRLTGTPEALESLRRIVALEWVE